VSEKSALAQRPGYLRGAAGLSRDVVPGRATIVEVHGVEVGLFRVDDAIYAVRNFCPHRGAPVCRGHLGGTMLPSRPGAFEFGLEGRVLHCPWHHWEYDVTTGESVFGVSKSRLVTYQVETYEVEESGAELYVWVKPPRASRL
jgi:nitrite reductase (NADH) small subunit